MTQEEKEKKKDYLIPQELYANAYVERRKGLNTLMICRIIL